MARFIPDRGYLLSSEGREITSMVLSLTKERLNDRELYDFSSRIHTYIEGTGTPLRQPMVFREPLTADLFVDRRTRSFTKLVSRETYRKYIRHGCFQVGSAAYYRTTDNEEITDPNEGYSLIAVGEGDREFLMFGQTGDNWALFCGTGEAGDLGLEVQSRFGEIALVVSETERFAQTLAGKLGARDWCVQDVIYSDAKTFRMQRCLEPLAEFQRSRLPTGSLSQSCLDVLEATAFEFLYDLMLRPSLFCKPETRYSAERECRMAFDMAGPIKDGHIRIEAPELLDLIDVVELA